MQMKFFKPLKQDSFYLRRWQWAAAKGGDYACISGGLVVSDYAARLFSAVGGAVLPDCESGYPDGVFIPMSAVADVEALIEVRWGNPAEPTRIKLRAEAQW